MSKKALLGGLLPFISNPTVLVAVALGATALTLYEKFSDKREDENGNPAPSSNSAKRLFEQSEVAATAEEKTVPEPLNTAGLTVAKIDGSSASEQGTSELISSTNNELSHGAPRGESETKKEMIRQAMSEMGKRSAAARARKKAAQAN